MLVLWILTSVYSQKGSGDVILERRFLLSKHFCHLLHNKMHVLCHSQCPIFCSLGIIDFILNLLLCPLGLIPSHPELASFCPIQTHSLVLAWFPWNGRVNGICCLDPTPLQTKLCALHSVYNDKVSEKDEVPKILGRSLDCQYTPLGHTNLPRRFEQDNLCRAELLDNFLDNFLLKLWLWDMAWRQLEVDMKVN